MPALVRKFVVVAAVEGLILHPSGQRKQRSLQIKYATHEISPLASSAIPSQSASVDVHGIIGLLSLPPVAYLIAISRREQVAQIRGIPIYTVTEIVFIPLSSQAEAQKAIDQAKAPLKQGSQAQACSDVDSNTSDDEEIYPENPAEQSAQASSVDTDPPVKESLTETRQGNSERRSSNVAEDVIGRKGQYGRFAERWFSRKGWSTEKRRVQGMSTEDAKNPRSRSSQGERPETIQAGPEERKGSEQNTEGNGSAKSVANTLLPKLLRTTRMLLGSRSFFFSYDIDITRRVGDQEKASSELPLHRSVDPLFFWNHHLALPFIGGGHHLFVLPLMQGFVGQRAFTVSKVAKNPSEATSDAQKGVASVVETQKQLKTGKNEVDFLLTLISRRSIKRPGLRYLRRGIDDEGETANTVETEQILSKASWPPNEKVYSFTQMRGSIPLFFSQTAYTFKPVPVLLHSPEVNQQAFQRHFRIVVSRYGAVQIVSLVDKKGGESEIGRKYEESTNRLNAGEGIAGKRIGFEWFDFHTVCRGMKFENVSLLMETLDSKLDEYGMTVELGSAIQRRQSGVLRTNCMDCLDRTNVVQSACAQRVLEKQLKEEGMEVDLLTDITTQWFNTLWADNGDQISREYSSTAALKGDYTRTRQRNYRGAINDLRLTLSRYYNNIVNDYFSQAAIDYLLGDVTSQIFDEFEATLENKDPAMSMAKLRANAIEQSTEIVIADQHEDLIGGWTLMSPQEPNSVRAPPFEECVLLITDAALYRVKFEWNVEKVASFERIDLRSILGILKGTYITSTLTATQRDVEKNFGFVIRYKEGIERVNTRSLSSATGLGDRKADDLGDSPGQKDKNGRDSAPKVLAFKAIYARDSLVNKDGREMAAPSEKELVNNTCEEIRRAALREGRDVAGFLEETDIISLEEAKKSTGLLEQWSHSLKKVVWA